MSGPYRCFSHSPFQERPLLEAYQKLLPKYISTESGMLSVYDTGFVKKGRHSAGVKRQYCGRLGKTETCQNGVFLAYAAGDTGLWTAACKFLRNGSARRWNRHMLFVMIAHLFTIKIQELLKNGFSDDTDGSKTDT